MNNLADVILTTDLFEKVNIRNNVLKEIIPKSLRELVGMEQI